MGFDKDDPQAPASNAEVQYTEPPEVAREASESDGNLDKPEPDEPQTEVSVQYTEPPE